MRKGELRTKIMDECPEGFEDVLKDFIDHLEGKVDKIVDGLNISNISDLGKIEDTQDMAKSLMDSLY